MIIPRAVLTQPSGMFTLLDYCFEASAAINTTTFYHTDCTSSDIDRRYISATFTHLCVIVSNVKKSFVKLFDSFQQLFLTESSSMRVKKHRVTDRREGTRLRSRSGRRQAKQIEGGRDFIISVFGDQMQN